MKTRLTRLSHVALSFCLAFVLLLTVLPMQGLAADEGGQEVTTDISALTLENIPDVLKNELNIAIDYSSALGINTYSLREAPVLKTGLAIGDAQRLDGLTIVNPDGTKTAYSFGADIKFIEDNAVKFIDNEIINKISITDGKLFFYQTKQSDSKLYLPLNISNGLLFKNGDLNMTLAPASLSLSLAQLKQINENEYAVQYDNVFAKGISLQYLSVYGGFKENIIINEKNGISEFSYILNIPGYKAELTDGGKTVTVYNKENSEESYVFGKPFAQDANGKLTDECNYKLTHVFGDRYILTLCADKDFLNDADTAYPVTVDPPLEVSRGSVEDATVSSAGTIDTTSSIITVGIDENGNDNAAFVRCNFLWYFRHLRPEDITSAYFHTGAISGAGEVKTLNLYDSLWFYGCDGMTFNTAQENQGEWQSSVILSPVNSDCDFQITQLMQKWLKYYLGMAERGKNPNYGFFLRSSNNAVSLYSAESTHPSFPYFSITYSEETALDDGYYYIENLAYKINLIYENETSGANVYSGQMQHCKYARWYVECVQEADTNNYGEVFYTIRPNKSDYLYLCSDAIDPYANNSNIYLDYTRQLWRIIKNANGTFRIIPANSTLQCITTNNVNLQNDSQEDDTANAYTYEYYGWGSMQWEFEALTTGVTTATPEYVGSDDRSMNCLGYVLGENKIVLLQLNSYTLEETKRKTIEYVQQTDRYLYEIESYDSPIRDDEYRICMRIGIGNAYHKHLGVAIEYIDMPMDYHYMVQNSNGNWSEKHGTRATDPIKDVHTGDPATFDWNVPFRDCIFECTHSNYYNSDIVYFAIQAI